ncbi:MAG: hypothetical protein VKQ33_00065 [Candidatus Sericytochromatia bacterium]|nr:hypothetical protein [Candidatus Sericytochromatia bacterium]
MRRGAQRVGWLLAGSLLGACDGLPEQLRPDELPARTPSAAGTGTGGATVAATLTLRLDEEATLPMPVGAASDAGWASADEAVVDVDLARGVAIGRGRGVTIVSRQPGDAGVAPATMAVVVASGSTPVGPTPQGGRPHVGAVLALVALPGRRLASAGADGLVWLTTPGTAIATPLRGHRGPVVSLAASMDGTRLVSGSHDRTVRVWDVASGRWLRTLEGAVGPARAVAVEGVGREVMAAGTDGVIRRYDLDTGLPRGEGVPAGGPVWSLALDPRGQHLAAGLSSGQVRLWRWPPADQGRLLASLPGAVTALAWATSGEGVWAGATAVEGRTLAGALRTRWPGGAGLQRALAVSGDGRWLVRVTGDGRAEALDVARGGVARVLPAGPASVTAAAFVGEAPEVALGHADGTLRVLTGVLDP